MANSKRVLVQCGSRSRPVNFESSAEDEDAEFLKQEAMKVFGDVLENGSDYFLQLKDEEWGMEFVDVVPGRPIPNKAVLKLVEKEKVNMDMLKSNLHF